MTKKPLKEAHETTETNADGEASAKTPFDHIEHKEKEPAADDQKIGDLVCNAPPEVRTMIMGMMRHTTTDRVVHPFFSKFSTDNIGSFLEFGHKEEMAELEIKKSKLWFHLLYVLLFLGFLIFVIVYLLPTHKDLLTDLIKIFVGLVGGFGAGYGLKSREK